MSSPRDVSSRGTDFGPEAGKHTEFRPVNPTARQARVLALDLGPPGSGEGEGVVSDLEGGHGLDLPAHILSELNKESEEEQIVSRRGVLWGREGRPSSPADKEEDATLGNIPHRNIECASGVQQISKMEAQGTRRYSSPAPSVKSCAAQLSSRRVNAKSGPSKRGAGASSHVQRQRHSAVPLHPSGPKRGQAWGNLKSNTKSRVMVSRDAQQPSSDSDPDSKSSDELQEMQPIRVSISRKAESQAKTTYPKEPGDVTGDLNIHAQASVPHLGGCLMISAPRRLTSAMGRQALGELEGSSSKKIQNVVWPKAEGRPNYPGAGAITGALPRATTWKKEPQEKKSPGGGPKVILGRAFPSWAQSFRATSLEPATFPPISGIQLLGKSRGCPLLPSGSKQEGTGRKFSARRARESQPVVGEDKDASTDPVLQAQFPTHGPGPRCLSVRHGEFTGGDADTRAPQVPAISRPFTMSQGGLPSRGPVLSGDQEPTVNAPILERQQPLPGAQGCPQCLVLQKEIDDLKKQLAALQSLTDKFQTL